MNNHPLDQLDAKVLDKESANTAPPLRKRDKSIDFLGISKAISIVKAKRTNRSLKSLPRSQQTTKSSIASQVDSLQEKLLLLAPEGDWLRSAIFPENVTKPAGRTALPGLQVRIERTEQLLYCNVLLFQDSVALSPVAGEQKTTDAPANAPQA
ncbi:hypothetical protein BGX30_007027, partial [Mortierella sp. GBA39]